MVGGLVSKRLYANWAGRGLESAVAPGRRAARRLDRAAVWTGDSITALMRDFVARVGQSARWLLSDQTFVSLVDAVVASDAKFDVVSDDEWPARSGLDQRTILVVAGRTALGGSPSDFATRVSVATEVYELVLIDWAQAFTGDEWTSSLVPEAACLVTPRKWLGVPGAHCALVSRVESPPACLGLPRALGASMPEMLALIGGPVEAEVIRRAADLVTASLVRRFPSARTICADGFVLVDSHPEIDAALAAARIDAKTFVKSPAPLSGSEWTPTIRITVGGKDPLATAHAIGERLKSV